MPGMVNTRAAPPVNVPAVIVTVNTPAAEMEAVPVAPGPPAMKVRMPGAAMASPAPLSVMMILPSVGIRVVGMRFTVMTTPPAPLTALLRVTAGLVAPRFPNKMATKVPVLLVSMITPASLVVAAAMVVDAA